MSSPSFLLFTAPAENLGQSLLESLSQYVCETVPKSEIKLIREALQRGQLTGGKRFRRKVSERLGVRISNKGLGRPKKVGE